MAQTYPDSRTIFTLGRAGIYPAGSWDIGGFNALVDIELGVLYPPVQAACDTCCISDHTDIDIDIAMNAATEHAKKAANFLNWVGASEFAAIFANSPLGFFPLLDAPMTLDGLLAQEIISWRGEGESSIRSKYQVLSRGTPNLENGT